MVVPDTLVLAQLQRCCFERRNPMTRNREKNKINLRKVSHKNLYSNIFGFTHYMHAMRILQPRIVHLLHVGARTAIQKGLCCCATVILAHGLDEDHLADPGQRMTTDHPGSVSFGPAYTRRQWGQPIEYRPCLVHFRLKCVKYDKDPFA